MGMTSSPLLTLSVSHSGLLRYSTPLVPGCSGTDAGAEGAARDAYDEAMLRRIDLRGTDLSASTLTSVLPRASLDVGAAVKQVQPII